MVGIFSNKQPKPKLEENLIPLIIYNAEGVLFRFGVKPYNSLSGVQAFYDEQENIMVSIAKDTSCKETKDIITISSVSDIFSQVLKGEWFIDIGSTLKLAFNDAGYSVKNGSVTLVSTAIDGFKFNSRKYEYDTTLVPDIEFRLRNKSKGVYHTDTFSTQIEYDRLIVRSNDIIVTSFKIPYFVPNKLLEHQVYCIKIPNANAMWLAHVITTRGRGSKCNIYYIPTMNNGVAPTLYRTFNLGRCDDIIGSDGEFICLVNNTFVVLSYTEETDDWGIKLSTVYEDTINHFIVNEGKIKVGYNPILEEPKYDLDVMQVSDIFGSYYDAYILDNGKISYLPDDAVEAIQSLEIDPDNASIVQITTRNSVSYSLGGK